MAFDNLGKDIKNIFFKSDNAVYQLIALNVIFFVAVYSLKLSTLFQPDSLLFETAFRWVSVPASFKSLLFKPWTIISYMFMHNGLRHIIWNMLLLYWFGSIFKDFMGSRRMIGLYIVGGLVGFLFYIISYNIFPLFKDAVSTSTMTGASAAVLAILFAIATKVPEYTIRIIVISIKLKWLALFIFLFDFLFMTGGNSGGHLAHLGGALTGFLFIKQMEKGNDITSWVNKSLDYLNNLFKKKSRLKVAHTNKFRKKRNPRQTQNKSSAPTTTVGIAEISQAEIDKILDKISEKGYDSLSKSELQILKNIRK